MTRPRRNRPLQGHENETSEQSAIEGKGQVPKVEKQVPEDRDRIVQKRLDRLTEVSRYAPTKKGHFLTAYSGKSRKAAIAAMCIDCSAFYQEEVRRCTVVACPLWEYRPYKQ